MDFTFLELHLHDAEFNAPFASGRSTPADADESDPASGEDEPEFATRVGPVAVLAAFAALALLVRYLRGGEAEQSTLDEVEA